MYLSWWGILLEYQMTPQAPDVDIDNIRNNIFRNLLQRSIAYRIYQYYNLEIFHMRSNVVAKLWSLNLYKEYLFSVKVLCRTDGRRHHLPIWWLTDFQSLSHSWLTYDLKNTITFYDIITLYIDVQCTFTHLWKFRSIGIGLLLGGKFFFTDLPQYL